MQHLTAFKGCVWTQPMPCRFDVGSSLLTKQAWALMQRQPFWRAGCLLRISIQRPAARSAGSAGDVHARKAHVIDVPSSPHNHGTEQSLHLHLPKHLCTPGLTMNACHSYLLPPASTASLACTGSRSACMSSIA